VAPERRLLKQNLRRSVLFEEHPDGARAVKRFHSESAWRRLADGARARREARRTELARAVGLPAPRVLAVRSSGPTPEVVFEWIEGARSLREVLARGAPPPRLAQRLGALLAHAHRVGLRHRDLHAGNVVLDHADAPWLVDLAAARVGVELGAADLLRDVVQLGADLRESVPATFRARVLAAWRARLPAELRASVARAGGTVARLEPLVRAARRAEVMGRVAVHRRESSAMRAIEGGVERRTPATDVQRASAPRAADAVERAAPLSFVGAPAELAWSNAVRFELHGIAAPLPLRLEFGPPPRATFAATPEHGWSSAHGRTSERAFARGAWLGALLDRGLALVDGHGAVNLPEPQDLGAALGRLALTDDEACALLAHVVAELGGGRWPDAAARSELVRGILAAQRGTRRAGEDLRAALERATVTPSRTSSTEPRGPAHAADESLPPAPVRRRVRAHVLRAAARAAAHLPPGWTAAAGRGAARLAARSGRGALARANLALALGDELDEAARRLVLEDATRFAGRLLAEWLRLARPAAPNTADALHGAWIDDAVELDASIERLDAVLARGRGALVVTAHLGNWELLCAALRRRGHHGAVVGRVRRRDPSHAWLTEMRRAYGVETIAQDTSPREALRVLARGGVLGLLSDLHVKRLDHVTLPFLGRPAPTLTAPAAFARAHHAPLVPVSCVARDRGRGRYVLAVEEPLALRADLPREAAALELLTRLNDVYSRWIRAHPEQWAWHQRRW
jgi:KDO2-lipid IV(A) lauroyltransferase